MKFWCPTCTKDGYTWLSPNDTIKTGTGINIKRYCTHCRGPVRSCYTVLKYVSLKDKNYYMNTADFGCDRCYVRFRCFTE